MSFVSCETAVYSNGEVRENVSLKSDEEYVLSETGGYAVIRIKK